MKKFSQLDHLMKKMRQIRACQKDNSNDTFLFKELF